MHYNGSQKLIKSLFLLSFAVSAFAADSAGKAAPTPDELHAELERAQKQFELAKELFNPYYAGPLITPSPHNVPANHVNLQPYLYLKSSYGVYTNNRRMQSTPNTYQIQALSVIQLGLTNWLDFTAVPQVAIGTWNKGEYFGHIQDFPAQVGFQICQEQPYVPAIRFVANVVVPTGHYKNLDPNKNGVDATGAGSYQYIPSLNIGKIFWWFETHPINFRASFNYTIYTTCHVTGFNAYGGGYGCDGHVRPGGLFAGDVGLEVSLTQKWVFAADIVYTNQRKTTFSGTPGLTETGDTASVGGAWNDQFSLAPAIEYNPSDRSGGLFGVWFSCFGKNQPAFVSLVLTYYWYW